MDDDSEHYFSWIDYVLFSLTLIFSFLVGIYFGLWGNKAHTTNEYLLGGRSMRVLPIALSVIATQVSGNTVIAVPAEIYKFGSYYFWTLLSDICAAIIGYYVCIPIYFKLQVTSIFEYVKLRFGMVVYRLCSVLFILSVFSYTPTVLYLPALTFSQVTGFGVYGITITVSAVCIIYTTIGGFKAVIWTDALQFGIMVGAMVAVLILGIISAGGFGNVWTKAVEGKRLDIFEFSPDPTLRDSFWSVFFGNIFFQLSVLCVSQSLMQKYLALSSFEKVKRCIIIHYTGVLCIKLTTTLTGIVAYANYAECDLFLSNKITKTDQLMPYFVMDITRNLPGLPGIYLIGIFSATLSTLSSALNSTAACIYQDLIMPIMSQEKTQEFRTKLLMVLVLILGVISVLLVILVSLVGGIFFFTTATQGITGGPLLGVLFLGMLIPFATPKGAFAGVVTALVFLSWMVTGNLWYKTQGLLHYPEKPASVENCTISLNATAMSTKIDNDDIFILYRISFWYNTMISTTIVILIGVIVSWFTKKDVDVNHDLLSPVIHRFLPKVKKSEGKIYYDVEKANVTIDSKDSENRDIK